MGMFKGKRAIEHGSPSGSVMAPERPVAVAEIDPILESRLRESVAAGGRFQLYYQSLVSVADGSLVGLEALLRWDSDTGRVSPATFIPVLESTGLIRELGPWIIAEACRHAIPWVVIQPDLLVTVNISPQQLESGFAETPLTQAPAAVIIAAPTQETHAKWSHHTGGKTVPSCWRATLEGRVVSVTGQSDVAPADVAWRVRGGSPDWQGAGGTVVVPCQHGSH